MKTCKVRSRLTVFDVGSVAGRPRSVSSVWSANSFVIDNTLSGEQNTQDNCPSIPSKCYISFPFSNSCHETAFAFFILLCLLVSTYVVCERLSVMHEPARVVEILVQILQNTPILKYSFRIPRQKWKLSESPSPSFRIPPPQMKFRQILAVFSFQFQNTQPSPPPLEKWNLGRSWHFKTFQFSVSEYPPTTSAPPPRNTNNQRVQVWEFQNTHFRIPISEYQWETMCGKLPHVETLSNPDNYSLLALRENW